jgi:hypothetical protein
MTAVPIWPKRLGRRLEVQDVRLRECRMTDRLHTEELIRERFRRSHGADLQGLMPQLFTMTDADHQLVGAFGLREAFGECLYMEQYIDQPVECAIAGITGLPVQRREIIEVGNLASDPGKARNLIVALTCYLHQAGFRWVVFTGVATLRAAFARLGLEPVEIAAADPQRLDPGDLARWGNYFAASPQVMAGDIGAGYRLLRSSGIIRPDIGA